MIILTFAFNVVVFMIPAAFASNSSRRLAKAWGNEWNLLVWAPVTPLALWGVFIAWGVTRDPTSHNLWPFELAMWGFLSVLLFAALRLAHHLTTNPRGNARP